MSYIWVIVGSVIGLALTSYSRWHMRNVFEPIERSNDPYVFLVGIIIILHLFYFGGKIGNTPKTKKINKFFEKNEFLGVIVVLGVLILSGIIGSYIVDFILY